MFKLFRISRFQIGSRNAKRFSSQPIAQIVQQFRQPYPDSKENLQISFLRSKELLKPVLAAAMNSCKDRIDMFYLYYLPFCMLFTSRDKLHERTAPLFLDEGQLFLHGDDLKSDLRKLDEHYTQLPDKVKQRGVMSFAHHPPTEGDFLVSKLWDRLVLPEWRESATRPKEPRSKEEDKKIIAEIDQITNAPSASRGSKSVDSANSAKR